MEKKSLTLKQLEAEKDKMINALNVVKERIGSVDIWALSVLIGESKCKKLLEETDETRIKIMQNLEYVKKELNKAKTKQQIEKFFEPYFLKTKK